MDENEYTAEEMKFYNALKVFGENCDLIHQLVFNEKTAKKRYKFKDQFTERSIVQLKKKFKKDSKIIDEIIRNKKPGEDVYWFEKKYNIDITQYNQARAEKYQKEGVFDKEEDDSADDDEEGLYDSSQGGEF